jgi:hypothetical protein
MIITQDLVEAYMRWKEHTYKCSACRMYDTEAHPNPCNMGRVLVHFVLLRLEHLKEKGENDAWKS